MSADALMMIVRFRDFPPPHMASSQELWNRLRSTLKGIVLFRQFDADPEQVKEDIKKALELALNSMLPPAFNAGTASACLIAATMNGMPVGATWYPATEKEIAEISPVFHYVLLLNHDDQKWNLCWWKLQEENYKEDSWKY